MIIRCRCGQEITAGLNGIRLERYYVFDREVCQLCFKQQEQLAFEDGLDHTKSGLKIELNERIFPR